NESIQPAQHEIRSCIPAVGCTTEAKIARLAKSVVHIRENTQSLATEGNFVHAVHPVCIVRKIVGRTVELPLPAGGDAEQTRDRERDFWNGRLRNVYANGVDAEGSRAHPHSVVAVI